MSLRSGKKAVEQKSRGSQTKLFKDWFVSKGDLMRMQMRMKAIRESLTLDDNAEGWYTEKQFADHYKDPEFAKELCKRKKAQGLFRRHPELPDREEATLYYGLIEMKRIGHSSEVVFVAHTVLISAR